MDFERWSEWLFSSHSTYIHLWSSLVDLEVFNWRFIWKLKLPQRWLIFLWIVMHERLLTNQLRSQWGLALNANCALCGYHDESIIYFLRDCEVSASLWKGIILLNDQVSLFYWHFEGWLINIFTMAGFQSNLNENWYYVFMPTIWRLWSGRCAAIFSLNWASMVCGWSYE